MNLGRMREVADRIRSVADPIRTVTVTVRERTWPGRPGVSGTTPVDFDTVLPVRYKVRQMRAGEIAASGGRYRDGAVRVGPITPPFTSGEGGGFSEAQLRPPGAPNKERLYILAGELAGIYALGELDTTHPLSWFLTLNRERLTP